MYLRFLLASAVGFSVKLTGQVSKFRATRTLIRRAAIFGRGD
jgi:hypothetical protein